MVTKVEAEANVAFAYPDDELATAFADSPQQRDAHARQQAI